MVSVATASYLLIQPFAGYAADKVPINITVCLGLVLSSLAIGAITFTSGFLLLILACIAGMGVGIVWTNSDTLVSSLADQNKLGTSMGAAQSFKEFGDMVGPLIVGALTQFFGIKIGFIGCSLLALLLLPFLQRSYKSI